MKTETAVADGSCETGIVFNIQRFTVHDGPGIRTEIFLKGCTLRCRWCSNPESQDPRIELGVYAKRCLGTDVCGECLNICPKNAIIFEGGKAVGINRGLCDGCMLCHKVCPAHTFKQWGEYMTADEVMKTILADRLFYESSGGGVTISGGESLYQWRFTKTILERCRAEGIRTCVETALHVKSAVLDEILPLTDLLITDLKHMDTEIHKKYIGAGCELIHENIRKVSKSGVPMVIRLPIIPGVNDSAEHVSRAADFIESLGSSVVQVQFLRFRRLGEEKYASIGMPYYMKDIDPPREEFEAQIKELVKIMTERGIPAFAGTTHKIAVPE